MADTEGRAAADSQNGTALHQASQIPGSGGFLPIFLPKEATQWSRGAISPCHSDQLESPIRVCYQLPKLVIRFDSRRCAGPLRGSLRLVLVALLVLILAEVLLRGGHCPVDLFIVLMMGVTLGEPRYFVDPLVGLLQVLLGVGLRLVR